jgi:hypothetical protein
MRSTTPPPAHCPCCGYDAEHEVTEEYIAADQTRVIDDYWYCLAPNCGWTGERPAWRCGTCIAFQVDGEPEVDHYPGSRAFAPGKHTEDPF